ncbi:MAG: hypothetical protein IT273_05890 [Chitinophagales bacterium]|nr:hypothetical protein [Chitinophagales bacterium]
MLGYFGKNSDNCTANWQIARVEGFFVLIAYPISTKQPYCQQPRLICYRS